MSDTSPLGKQLGQLRPANTTAASLYSPATNVIAELTYLTIVNTSGATHDYRLFHDDDGTTYDETTALAWDEALDTNFKEFINLNGVWMADASGNFAVRSDTNDAFTFTLYGREHEK